MGVSGRLISKLLYLLVIGYLLNLSSLKCQSKPIRDRKFGWNLYPITKHYGK